MQEVALPQCAAQCIERISLASAYGSAIVNLNVAHSVPLDPAVVLPRDS